MFESIGLFILIRPVGSRLAPLLCFVAVYLLVPLFVAVTSMKHDNSQRNLGNAQAAAVAAETLALRCLAGRLSLRIQ